MKFVVIYRGPDDDLDVGVFGFLSLAERWAIDSVNERFDLDLKTMEDLREAELEYAEGIFPTKWFGTIGEIAEDFAIDIYSGRTNGEFHIIN